MALCTAAVACSGDGDALCSGAVSIPSYTMRFASGLDNFSEDQYEQLRLDTLEVVDVLQAVSEDSDAEAPAAELVELVTSFVMAMDAADWDVSVALSSKDAVDAANELGDTKTLALANTVDVFLISRCGLPSTLEPVTPTVETLPAPSVPSPTQTDPPASPPNQESEDRELGRTVATLFGLVLSENDMLCLGSELQGIYDVTSDGSDMAQYQRQFQKAFDSCSIDFTVPVE